MVFDTFSARYGVRVHSANELVGNLADAGFDIVHPFDVAVLAQEGLEQLAAHVGLEQLAARGSRTHAASGMRAILIGNTRALWPRFLAARAADPTVAASSDPIERYTETIIEAAIAREINSASEPRRATVLYPHRRYDGAYLPFQRLAVAAGLAWRAPTQLLIHPTYGPWFALRALVLVPSEIGSDPFFTRDPITAPCACDATCMQKFEAAQAGGDWRAWLAVRDACTVGRDYRYSDAQIAYHYTKDPAFLVP